MDFFDEHPIITIIVVSIIIITIAMGIVMVGKNARNMLFNGNEQVVDTIWRYEWAILKLGNGELIEGKVTSWKDFSESDMIQFTMDGISYLTHSSNVILCTKEP